MKLLLLDPSEASATFVRDACARHAELEFLEPATSWEQGVERAVAEHPDVVLLDPRLSKGSEVAKLLEQAPAPIVVFSAHLDSARVFSALEAGAVDVLPKPRGGSEQALARFEHDLARTVAAVRDARVVGQPPSAQEHAQHASVVLIGAATGGPLAIREILRRLEPPFPAPIVIATPTYAGFDQGLARWLDATEHTVSVLRESEELYAGDVYLCPADGQLTVVGRSQLALKPRSAEGGLIDPLFTSAAEAYGSDALGVLLSGAGSDGAQGLLALRQHGALTLTQLGASCVVDGMPAAARVLNASTHELDLGDLAEAMARACGGNLR